MTEPPASGKAATPTTVVKPTARTRFGFRGRKSATEEQSPVERPSRVVFQASASTIATSRARHTGDSADGVLYWGPGTTTRANDEVVAIPDGWDTPPVFVTGSDPADREALRQLLGAHPAFSAGPETGLLAELAESVRDNQEGLVHLGFPEQYWYKRAGEQFASLEARQAAAAGKRRWVAIFDPSRLPLATLDRMFPTSRVIHIVSDGPPRRGVRRLRAEAARLSAGRYLEIRGRDLRSDPGSTEKAVLDFLEEPAG